MAGYIGSVPVPQATETRDVYTATSNQTTFTTGGYTPNFVSVYLNGVHLARADYTATNGSDVVLAAGAAADDTVEIVSFATFEVSAQTFTGDVTASGGTFLPTGDTAAGDDAAVGYAAADGLVLTGQGSTSDVTIKNDADATVMSIPTGTTGATFAGDVIVPDGDLILGSTAVTSTAAELNILDGVTATAAEINLIDGGTARGTTAVADGDGLLVNDAGTMRMTTVQTVKTFMTAGLGTPAIVFPSNWASPTNNYTSSDTWSKGSLADDDYVWFYLVNSGGGGGNARPGFGGNAMLLYGTAATFNGAAYTIGAAKAGQNSTQGTTQNATTVTLSSSNGSVAFTPGDIGPTNDVSGISSLQTNIRSIDGGTNGTYLIGAPTASYTINTGALPSGYGRWTISETITGYNSADADSVFGGGAGFTTFSSVNTASVSLFAGDGGASDGAAGAAPGGGGAETNGGTGASGAAGSVRVYHV